MISDDDVEAALTYLRDSAKPAAVARSQARTLEKYLGVVEAQQKVIYGKDGRSNAASQDLARASPEFKQAIDAWAAAIEEDAKYTMLREAASARIEAWRTQSSNARAERI